MNSYMNSNYIMLWLGCSDPNFKLETLKKLNKKPYIKGTSTVFSLYSHRSIGIAIYYLERGKIMRTLMNVNEKFPADSFDKYTDIIFKNNDIENIQLINDLFKCAIVINSINNFMNQNTFDRDHEFDICSSVSYANYLIQCIDQKYFKEIQHKFTDLTESEKRHLNFTLADFINYLYVVINNALNIRIENKIFNYDLLNNNENTNALISLFCYDAFVNKDYHYNIYLFAKDNIDNFNEKTLNEIHKNCYYDFDITTKYVTDIMKLLRGEKDDKQKEII